MTLRERYLRAVEDYYPFDADQEIDDDREPPTNIPMGAFKRNGRLHRYVLVQGDSHDRTWHVFADTVKELLEYQEQEEFGWWPILVADLNTGQTANVEIKCSIDAFGKGPQTFDPADEEAEDA